MTRKITIIVPFWKQPFHVGSYRIERMIRWLSEEGVSVVLVCAGTKDEVTQQPWGREISIKDPLGLYTRSSQKKDTTHPAVSFLAYLLLTPDPTILWAKRAAAHPLTREHGKGSDWVLSSSPPESGHLASARLAKHLDARLIVDMRDGWLDEPLKPTLQRLFFRRWQEGAIERRVLTQAHRVLVTSQEWKNALVKRFPAFEKKISVVTNTYPPGGRETPAKDPLPTGKIILLHTGRFSGSSVRRRVDLLLTPLLEGLKNIRTSGEVHLMGKLRTEDILMTEDLSPAFRAVGWDLLNLPSEPRENVLKKLSQVHGLLLLSASEAAIPSKFFEYLVSTRPVLCFTLKDSAVWSIGKDLPQVFLMDYSQEYDPGVVESFIGACSKPGHPFRVPEEFSERRVKDVFMSELLKGTSS